MRGPLPRDINGCSIFGLISRQRRRLSGETAMRAISSMRERANGLGGGFAAYGIYPDHADEYALHLMYEDEEARHLTEEHLGRHLTLSESEPIPTRPVPEVPRGPLLWRYFALPQPAGAFGYGGFSPDGAFGYGGFSPAGAFGYGGFSPDGAFGYGGFSPAEDGDGRSDDDRMVELVMHVNSRIPGAFVASSGKNMGIFKGVGFPEDIGRFYRLEEYEGWCWTVHGRFPTNSVAWWGGAHPFGILDWSVVHNGEISSYGINRRYLENFGYVSCLQTDTEVLTYLFDLLVRRHGLSLREAAQVVAAPLWSQIERMPEPEREVARALRTVYASALVNGPFSVVVGGSFGMMALVDRIKLRPLVAGWVDDVTFVASEESAIRLVARDLEEVWMPRGGQPVLVELEQPEEVVAWPSP